MPKKVKVRVRVKVKVKALYIVKKLVVLEVRRS